MLGGGAITDGTTDAKNASGDGPLGWIEDLLNQWGTVFAAATLQLVCFQVLSFILGLRARCMAAHRIWGCKFHLVTAVLPSILQWMAI
jgi:hypothetical protein